MDLSKRAALSGAATFLVVFAIDFRVVRAEKYAIMGEDKVRKSNARN